MILDDIVDFLKEADFSLTESVEDGRINSAVNEGQIIELLESEFGNSIKKSKKRDWFDFAYETDDKFYPVNIKITKLSTDNLNCKLGIYYALSGKIPSFDNEINWVEFINILKQDMKNNSKDYYFLILNKNDLNDIFYTSLKSIKTLTPNGNNLPFQANWAVNKEKNKRNFNDAKKFILENLGKSLKLRANAYNHFMKVFSEFKGKL